MITRQIREILSPYLDWQSRVNLNVALPVSCRVYKRFSQEECDAHEIYIWTAIFKVYLTAFETGDSRQKRAELSYTLFNQFNNPRSFILPMRHVTFKMAVIGRLLYFADKKDMKRMGVSPELSGKLSRLCKQLIPKMLSLKYLPMKNTQSHCIQIV
jgi:hypothetical protein